MPRSSFFEARWFVTARSCTETITLASPQPVSFAGDAWLGYVPIRMSDTICVQERLPPGAAAVLINQTHTYRDLFMPINATEKRLFDAIDGTRSIGEIVASSAAILTQQSTARHGAHLL